MKPPELRSLLALAYLDGINRRPQIAPTDPLTVIRLDDTGRAPVVALRPAGGGCGTDYPCPNGQHA